MADTGSINRSSGFTMIEILVSLVIILLGLLGLMGLQVRVHQAELESYQRAQALILMSDIVDRVTANRPAARCYGFTAPGGDAPYLGVGSGGAPACTGWGTAETQQRAIDDMNEWNALLQGAAETKGGVTIGAMIGARGCVSYDEPTSTYTVAVAWQGINETVAPANACGKDLYGKETLRRVVSTTFRIATLNGT